MALLITKNPESVYHILYNALDKLIDNRISDKAFTDQEDVTTKGYFSTLEGLEAILIPIVNLPKNLFWQQIISDRPQLIDILKEDITFVLSYNQKSKGNIPPIEQGTPYFIQGKGVRQAPYWTVECSSFTISVLTNLLSLNEKYGLGIGPGKPKIVSAIGLNLEWVKRCKRDNGWAWTTDSSSHPWPTWSILDTFEEVLNNEELDDFHKEIKAECAAISNNICESFETDVAGSYQNEWKTKVEDSTPYDIEVALDIVRLMLGVSLHKTYRDIKPISKMLFSWCAKTDFKNLYYTYHLATKNDNIPDGSLVPMTFRTLLVMAGTLGPKHRGILDKIGTGHEVIINRVYSNLMKSHITHGRYSGLWGVPNGGTTYELYYTERTIEALTEFLLHYGDNLKIDFKGGNKTVRSNAKTSSNIEEVISSNKRLSEPYPALGLPVLDAIANKVIREQQDLFQDISLVLVLHILDDLIPFIDKFVQLGCTTNNIYLIAKTYDYPEKKKILTYLNKTGYNTFQPLKPDHGSYQEQCTIILDKCIDKAKTENRKILIVEDGGYFAPLIHEAKYSDSASNFIGAIEQTTKGHRRDAEIKELRIPIISVANSRMKKILEGDEVAQTLQENVVKVLKEIIKKPSSETNVLVIGYGTIGNKLANYLADKKLKVSVYDSDKFRRMEASLDRNITVLENLDDLTEFDIIIGCSGNTSLNDPKYYWNLKHNVYLISGSSERVEFSLEILEALSDKVEVQGIVTEYRLKKDKKIINLLCEGEPINFSLSGGIAKSIIDPVYAEMFLSAVYLKNSENIAPTLSDVSEEIETEVLVIYKDYYRT